MRCYKRGRARAALALIAGLIAWQSVPAHAAEPSRTIDIPALPLVDALALYARQTGHELLYRQGDLASLHGRRLIGRMAPARALSRLLDGSGFHARRLRGGAYLIERDDGVAPAPARTPPPATALVPAAAADIVVVGTPGGAGVSRRDAAFAVTSIDADRISRLAPNSPADVLRLVPGLTVETSGGKNGANIFVRGYPSGGDAEYVTFQEEGVPFFPPATLSFLENSQLVRIDETVQRVEAVRGGTGALFASGQPGVTVNIVQREGGAVSAGALKLSATSFGDLKADGFVSGPLDTRTRYMLGGHYGSGRGIRSPGFVADRGGQITANLRRDLGGGGSLLVFARYLDDRSQWLLPIPLVQSGRRVTAYPGFDPGTGTLVGRDVRRGTLPGGARYDLNDGRGARLVHIGANWESDLGDGVRLRDKVSWLTGRADTTGLVPAGAGPQSAAAFAARLGGTIASLRTARDETPVGEEQSVIEAGIWTVRKRVAAVVNDASVEWRAGPNKTSVGVYAAHTTSRDRWNIGNDLLLTARPRAQRLDMVLASGAVVSRDGFAGGSSFLVDARYAANDVALYAVEEARIGDRIRIDGGVRYQRHAIDGHAAGGLPGGPGGPDGDAATLYDNADLIAGGARVRVRYRDGAWSWTGGVSWRVVRHANVFARYSRGNSFPFFDNVRDGLRIAPRIDTVEGGVTITTRALDLYATAFRNGFDGLSTTVITDGAPRASTGGARATGVELEGIVRPWPGVSAAFTGTWLDATYHRFFGDGGAVDLGGNRVQRQPRWQWRLEPAYDADVGGWRVRIATTISFIGDRFSDVENAQLLPRFVKLDAALTVHPTPRLTLQLVADNLTDAIGLTEANPRTLGAQGQGAILARPILGRSVEASARYRF